MNLPASFQQTITEVYGEAGRAWLADFPATIADAADRWSLHLEPHFPLSYNFVAPATRADGTRVVLKAGVPNPELTSEMAALHHYAGQGAVQVLESDRERGLMLLARVEPGDMLLGLAEGDDDRATRIAAGVMGSLWKPPPEDHPFITVEVWGRAFARLRDHYDGGSGPFDADLVDRTESLYADLQNSQDSLVVLHGDLHHENILSSGQGGWLAIDPKGVVGEPAYEAGALLRNAITHITDHGALRAITARRLNILAESLGLDRDRMFGWTLAGTMLSAVWSWEDHGSGWDEALNLAEALAGVD